VIDAHIAAVKVLLEAQGVTVHTQPPQDVETRDAGSFPYVVLHSDSGARSSSRLAAAPHRADFVMQTTLVSLSEANVQSERAFVVDALALRRPVVAGRVCSLVTHLPGPSMPTRDSDIPGRPVFVAFDRWSFYSLAQP